MEVLDANYLFGLAATPFGLASLGLIITSFLVEKATANGWKIFISWTTGIILSVVMLLLGRYFDFGAYAAFEFNTLKDWLTFAAVALSPGMISNGIYDSKALDWLLSILGAKK